MANFGPLAAEIGPEVWGTPANFKGFPSWQSPIFGRAAITLGIGPHSSLLQLSMCYDFPTTVIMI